jgi:hypothetical protein
MKIRFPVIAILIILLITLAVIRTPSTYSSLPVYLAKPVILQKTEQDRIAKQLGFENTAQDANKETIVYELPHAKLRFRLFGRGGFLYERTDSEKNIPDVSKHTLEADDIACEFLQKHNLLPADSDFGHIAGRYSTGNNLVTCFQVAFNPGKIPVRTRARMISIKVSPTRQIRAIDWRWARLQIVNSGAPRTIDEAKAITPFEPKDIKEVNIEYRWTTKKAKLYLVPKYMLTTRYDGYIVPLYPRFDGSETYE